MRLDPALGHQRSSMGGLLTGDRYECKGSPDSRRALRTVPQSGAPPASETCIHVRQRPSIPSICSGESASDSSAADAMFAYHVPFFAMLFDMVPDMYVLALFIVPT